MLEKPSSTNLSNTQLKGVGDLINNVFGGTSASVGAASTALGTFMASNPAGWILAIGAIVGGVVLAYDALTISLEEQMEILENTRNAYDESIAKTAELQTELQNTKARIDELQDKPNLTFVEQNELERLREVTKELELIKKLSEEDELKKAQALYKENKKTFEAQLSGSFGLDYDGLVDKLSSSVTGLLSSSDYVGIGHLKIDENITDMLAALDVYKKYKDIHLEDMDLSTYNTSVENITNSVKENGANYLNTLSPYRQNIIDISTLRELTEEEQTFYDYLTDMQKRVYEYYDPTTWNNVEFDSIFDINSLEITKEKLLQMLEDGIAFSDILKVNKNLSEAYSNADFISADGKDSQKIFYDLLCSSVDAADELEEKLATSFDFTTLDLNGKTSDIESAYSTITNAMQEYNEQGYLNMNTVDSLIALDDAYVNQLIDENGNLQYNAEAFNELAKIKLEEAKAEIYRQALSRISTLVSQEQEKATLKEAQAHDILSESIRKEAQNRLIELENTEFIDLGEDIMDAADKKAALLDNQIANLTFGTKKLDKAVGNTKNTVQDFTQALDAS